MQKSSGSRTGVWLGNVYPQLMHDDPSTKEVTKNDDDVQIAASLLYPDPAPNV